MKKLLVGGLVFMFSLLFSAVSYAQPVLNSFDPLSGPVGTVVNVNGINLLNTTDVTFDGVPAIFSVANSGGTRIVATVPLGAPTGPIEVTTPSGTATSVTDFIVSDVPVLVSSVPLDIKPRRCPNRLNVRRHGSLRAAILGTDNLDVNQINPDSLQLEGVAPFRWRLRDVATPFEPFIGKEEADDCTNEGRDGFLDLNLRFSHQAIVEALGEVENGEVRVLTLEGELFDGTPIVGEDVVVIN